MVNRNEKPKATQAHNLSSLVEKAHDEEIKVFLVVLTSLMKLVPCPRTARESYLATLERRLRNEGPSFLAACRSFPIYGIKLLGNDHTGFPLNQFKVQTGKCYPKFLAWFWSELERYSKVTSLRKEDIVRIRRVLTVLSFARMIRTSSLNQVKAAVTDFERKVTQPEVEEEETQPKALWPEGDLLPLLGIPKEVLDVLAKDVDLGSLSLKPCALKDRPAFPKWFRTKFKGKSQRLGMAGSFLPGPVEGFKEPPYGKVHVLVERGGKLRLIVPYNTPFVHSTGLYGRAVACLNRIPQSVHHDQKKGHLFAQRLSARGVQMVSSDLSAFTDSIRTDALKYGLRCLGLSSLERYLFNLPISMPNGKVIVPLKLLMGLKGCFEMGTLLHNYVVQRAGIYRYVMCGDDLLFEGDLSEYEKALEPFGPTLNRKKTVVSNTTCVFCGEYYFRGHRISPITPNISAFFKKGKVASCSVVFSALRSAITLLSEIAPAHRLVGLTLALRSLLGSAWKGPVYPGLPQKLRGLGLYAMRRKSSLEASLTGGALKCAKLSIGFSREDIEANRWFGLPIELAPDRIASLSASIQGLPGVTAVWPPRGGDNQFPALLSKGVVRLDPPKVPKKAPRKNHLVVNLHDVYLWYYDDIRIPTWRFAKT